MYYCDNSYNFGVNKNSCTGDYQINLYNFQNFMNSSITIFSVTTLNNWQDIYFAGKNSNKFPEVICYLKIGSNKGQ